MKKIGIYLGITFATAWFIEYAMIANGGLQSRMAPVLLIAVLFMPALGNLLTRIVTKEGFSDMYLRPDKTDRNTMLVFGAAWLLPVLAVVFGAALYFLVRPSMLDLHMEHSIEQYTELYAQAGRDYTREQIQSALRSQILISMLFLPVLNLVPSLASELGWRGYLLPKLLERYRMPGAVLIGGVAWALWYGPLIEMGYYYGTGYAGYPFTGMAAMTVLCLVLGTFFSWLWCRTKSCASSAIAFSVFSSFFSVGIYFCRTEKYSPFIGPVSTGLLGGAGFLILAVFAGRQLMKMNKINKSGNSR